MAGASSLKKAQKNKNDEWYTQLADIENELKYYREHFRGKVVLCNCDDPYESWFFKYFAMNFNYLEIKKLIATSYASSSIMYTQLSLFGEEEPVEAKRKGSKPYKIEITKVEDINGDGAIDLEDVEALLKKNKPKLLKGDGDFRSDECIELLKESDIVVTNPPFSLFREYIGQLIEYDKKFLVIGRMTALHAKEIFPLIQSNKIWVGVGFNISLVYKTPYANNLETNKKFVENKGYDANNGFIKVPQICWYTNLDLKKRHEKFIFYKKYNEKEYPKYDNFDAIEVDTVKKIPDDYYGIMGVPDTFISQYNPDEFEIIGRSGDTDWVLNECEFFIKPSEEKYKKCKEYNVNWRQQNAYLINEKGEPYKIPYSRIFIKRIRQGE
ncbi:MAG: adenine-specific methyltransferase EcoRI family protein [Acetatifactor sp.]